MKKIAIIFLCFWLFGCMDQFNIKQESALDSDDIDDYEIAKQSYKARQFVLAKKLFTRILKKNPSHPDKEMISLKLGNIDLREGKYEKAVDNYLVMLKEQPRNSKVQHNIAVAYLSLAEDHFKNYMALNSKENKRTKKIVELLSAIEKFAGKTTKSETSLDDLADIFKDSK